MLPAAPPPGPSRLRRWVSRFGVAGFVFFLVKGLLWLAAPSLLVALGVGC
ncbi:MAG TPA: hypothetical protein VD962_03190 [Rubricoccaceae bacterium]|nr:hypothetical protein [Rubricoccaceae bacterium]